jgi:hypothetical protein
MRATGVQINQLVLDQLARGEMRLLTLVVAVRKALGATAFYKGDLSAAVSAVLRKLVCSKTVTDNQGVFSLTPPNEAGKLVTL